MIKLTFAAIVLLTASLSWAGPGDDESAGTRGGGNIIASEFFDIGIEVLNTLEPRSPVIANGQTFDVKAIKNIFHDTRLIISEQNLYLNGSVVDAINYPKKNRIEINAVTWKTLAKKERYRLVAHEILGLSGIPDIQYRTSQDLLKIAYVGINWERGYRPACQGLRFLNDEQSKKLMTAIIAYYGNSKTTNFSLPAFSCVRGMNFQGFEYTSCDLDLTKPHIETLHANLFKALEYANVAKFTTGYNSEVENYEVAGLTCSSSDNMTKIRCGINTYWTSGCKTP